MYMNGEKNGDPTKMPVALMDILASHHLKQGILLALYERERSGLGKYVHVSLFAAAVASLQNQVRHVIATCCFFPGWDFFCTSLFVEDRNISV